MQLARGFFLTPQKTIKRKLTEMLIAMELEQRFTKQQIFEFYGNWVTWAARLFEISGFGEAAHAYSTKISRTLLCRKLRCWRELFSGQAIFRPTAILSARRNAGIWCSTAWSRPMPSPESRRIRPKPLR